MIIPEELLEKLVCSICFKNLSVGPVKVYPNRQIKCGRCSQKDDGGTESSLYQTIARNLLFPCMNRFDGCKEVLTISDMKYHENTCNKWKYECPLCDHCAESAYNFNLHLHRHHQKNTLHATEFLIDLQKGTHGGTYFYGKDLLLLFITFRLDAPMQKLFLNIAVAGKNYQGDVIQKFFLHNKDNQLTYATNVLPCSKFGLEPPEGFDIDISFFNFIKDVICKFSIKEEPILQLKQSGQIINPLDDCAMIRCQFHNISTYEDEVFYPTKFVVNDIIFEVSIIISDAETTIYLDQSRSTEAKSCYVFATFTLISNQTKEDFATQGDFLKVKDKGLYLAGCLDKRKTDLLNPENGYVDNDSLVIEIKCQVKYPVKEILCPYCASCKKCEVISPWTRRRVTKA